MIDGLTNAGAIPVLDRLIQFAGQRHRILSNNIANLSTPGFRPADVSVKAFQAQLGNAIDERREEAGATFRLASTAQVQVRGHEMSLQPEPLGENLLFHDGNDRDVERTMQALVENFMTFRAAAQLLKNRFDAIGVAIRERL